MTAVGHPAGVISFFQMVGKDKMIRKLCPLVRYDLRRPLPKNRNAQNMTDFFIEKYICFGLRRNFYVRNDTSLLRPRVGTREVAIPVCGHASGREKLQFLPADTRRDVRN